MQLNAKIKVDYAKTNTYATEKWLMQMIIPNSKQIWKS